jgi:hypothetical protein
MIFPIEIVLKGRDFAVAESLAVPHGEPATWNDDAVRAVLAEMLRAIGRAENPAAAAGRAVLVQGFSWIVEPAAEGGVVVAIEIPMGAAVAGPFAIEQAALDQMIGRVVQAERRLLSTPGTIH